MNSSAEKALARLLAAIDCAEMGDTRGGFGPGYENGFGIEVGTELQSARLLARQVIADSGREVRSAFTFDHWLKLNQPSGCVGDMERGWNACLSSFGLTPATALPEPRIVEIWNSMPGGPDGWLKHFGFIQFAQAVIAAQMQLNSVEAVSSAPSTPAHK